MTQSLSFAHLTDPHLTALAGVKASQLCNKRILGYLSWRFSRQYEHRREILEALQRDLQLKRPDHLVVSGDLTHIGLPDEFQQALQWLRALGTPDAVTVVPGNHDAYVRAPWEKTFALWWPYMASDADDAAVPTKPPEPFPSVRIRGPVAFIGLSSAHPSLPFLAVGSVGRQQLERLATVLRATGEGGYLRTVTIHHPPLPGAVPSRKHLTDSQALCDVLKKWGAELVLHGHTHYASRMELAGPHGRIPVIGIPSASAMGHKPGRRAQYYLYRVAATARGWSVAVSIRGYSVPDSCFIGEGEEQWLLEGGPAVPPRAAGDAAPLRS